MIPRSLGEGTSEEKCYMRGRRYLKRIIGKREIVVVGFLCFFLAAATALFFVDKEAVGSVEASETWSVKGLFSAANRGSERNQETAQQVARNSLKGILQLSFPSLSKNSKNEESYVAQLKSDQENSGELNEKTVKNETTVEPEQEVAPVAVLDTEESKNPMVLIYHTHATESYQPLCHGNFHCLEETGTVREVGNELEHALEGKGIAVIHDKVLHDSPSYNQSYARSLQTVQSYLRKNPSIKIVIDLHRDAALYSGNRGKTIQIEGKTAATYSLVLGKGNANYNQLKGFANQINAKADRLYPGFSGRIIEKEYRFNQYVSDRYLLLEVGNNENTIEQAKITGIYFADVLEAYIREME